MSSPVALVSTSWPDLAAVAVMPVVDDCAFTASASAERSDASVMVAEMSTAVVPVPVSFMLTVPAVTSVMIAVVVALALTPVGPRRLL